MAVAIYARQSVDKKDSISIEAQINLCKKECNDSERSFLIYKDRGYSGKNTDRPEFQKMMSDIESGKIEQVVVYRLDRLSRSIVDFGQMWQILDKYKVAFMSVNERFDTNTPMGRAMIYIIMVFAQLERETISERIRDNYYERIKYGTWPGGPAPYGFDNGRLSDGEGKQVPTLVPNGCIETVKRIFEEYEGGSSLSEIARGLTDDKIPSVSGKVCWNNVGISRILHNPVYTKADVNIYSYYLERGVDDFSNDIDKYDGTVSAMLVGKGGSCKKYTDLKERVVALTNFAGVISSEQWLNCQARLERNASIKNTGKGKYSWLTGVLKCADCGYALLVKKSRGKLLLVCSGRINMHICNRKDFDIDITEIEAAVGEELEMILDKCQSGEEENICVAEPQNAGQKMRLLKTEQRINNLIRCMAESSELTVDYLNKELERLDAEKKKIISDMQEAGRREKKTCENIVFSCLDSIQKHIVAEAFIEKIFVSKSGIEIVWRV